jgi:putative transposase
VRDSGRPSRRSIRLPNHDYSLEGEYFVTICTRGRRPTLTDPELQCVVQSEWDALSSRVPLVETDAFVIMPNHVHSIIVILPPGESAGRDGAENDAAAVNRAPTLGAIVGGLKGAVSREAHARGFTDFAWQRNYYEHVIRTLDSLETIRQYIADNPERWQQDRENPDAVADARESAFWRRFGDRRQRASTGDRAK